MTLRSTGLSHDEIITTLQQMKDNDVRWRDGRAFTLAYSAGDEVLAVAEEAYRAFASENALNTDAFPSLRVIQAQVVEIVIDWLQGDSSAAGFMTSGGTESILLAVKASRERGKKERGITQPNVVLPTSAHAAFEKACYYFGLESRRVAVSEDWRANPEAMAAAVDDNTVLLVGSAPQYPQGVVDPIEAIAAIAAERDINCHVDGCMGGVSLTYLKRLGYAIPAWNFEVPGVTSISVDRLHRQGRFGHRVAQQEAAQLSDLCHRQLARRHVRLIGHLGHQGRRVDGCSVGRDELPRRRGLHARHIGSAPRHRRVGGWRARSAAAPVGRHARLNIGFVPRR